MVYNSMTDWYTSVLRSIFILSILVCFFLFAFIKLTYFKLNTYNYMYLKLRTEVHKIYLNFNRKVTTRTNSWRILRGVKNCRNFLLSQLTKNWEQIDLLVTKFNSHTRTTKLKLRESRKIFF